MTRLSLLFALCFVLPTPASATNYFVAPNGDNAAAGTIDSPWRTIQKAADTLSPGDTCFIRGGVYRETVVVRTSGEEDAPIRFVAHDGEEVILSGTAPIDAQWELHREKIYKARVDVDVSQLFFGRRMMVEARWPNQPFDHRWDKQTWAAEAEGSEYGKIVDPALATTGIDWTGALATLNVGSWTTHLRTVREHRAGGDSFCYDRDMGKRFELMRPHPPGFNRYFLWGKLEALDAPGEWFFDRDAKTLYFQPPDGKAPDGKDPAGNQLEGKVRAYALLARDVHHVELRGLRFFACTFLLEDADHCSVDDCELMFPTCVAVGKRLDGTAVYVPARCRHVCHEYLGGLRVLVPTLIAGEGNTARNCRVAYSEAPGFLVAGRNNTIENCLIHDIDWRGLGNGTVGNCAAVHMSASATSVFRRNTVYNVGSSEGVVLPREGPSLCGYNYVHHGGLVQSDGSLIQCSGIRLAGTVIRYNWVHNHDAFNWGGIGIRGDDLTRNLLVHHNVARHCKCKAIMVKGDENLVYNNSCFDNTLSDLILWSSPEPHKGWAPNQWDHLLEHQNANSKAINNYAPVLTGQMRHEIRRARAIKLPAGELTANYHPLSPIEIDPKDLQIPADEPVLRDPANLDFRPRPGSPLIDAGRPIDGITDGYRGRGADIGAYEAEDRHYWIPGHQTPEASKPVPPHRATGVKTDAELIWLEGRRSASHDVYLGVNHDAVAAADRNSTEFKGNVRTNIYAPEKLDAGRGYYWRVDAVAADGTVRKGGVWTFAAITP